MRNPKGYIRFKPNYTIYYGKTNVYGARYYQIWRNDDDYTSTLITTGTVMVRDDLETTTIWLLHEKAPTSLRGYFVYYVGANNAVNWVRDY